MTRIVTMSARAMAIGLGMGALMLPAVASAHPDHGSAGDFGLLHFATDPFHLGLTGAALLLFVVARRTLRTRRAESRQVR